MCPGRKVTLTGCNIDFRSDTENEDRIQNDISKNTNIVKDKKRKKKSNREKSSGRKKKSEKEVEVGVEERRADTNIKPEQQVPTGHWPGCLPTRPPLPSFLFLLLLFLHLLHLHLLLFHLHILHLLLLHLLQVLHHNHL